MPQIPDVMKCPEKLLPLKQWEDSFLSDFSQLREVNIVSLPSCPFKAQCLDIYLHKMLHMQEYRCH